MKVEVSDRERGGGGLRSPGRSRGYVVSLLSWRWSLG